MSLLQRACLAVAALLFLIPVVHAADVQLGGIIGNRAILIVNGGRPQTLAAGAVTKEGVRLLSVSGDEAAIEIDGRRARVALGEQPISLGGNDTGRGEVRLTADSRGHFSSAGLINGSREQLLVDTGATFVSMGADAAKRAGIDYRAGSPAISTTANGQVRSWIVRLDTVQVGGIVLHGVDGVVHESPLPVVLLGMSFLNRTEMRREGNTLLLRKTY